jgi:antitoxin ParD1/3/4
MAEVRKVSITLTLDQIEALKTAVKTGDYATTGEVVREAIRDWQLKRELRKKEIERLPELWDEGKASGPTTPVDFDELRRDARRRLKAIQKTAGNGR